MDKVIKVLVLAAVVALGYLSYQSIATPVKFDKEQIKREEVLQKQLKKIANYQDAYEDIYHRFASAEELIAFLEGGKLYYVKAEGEYTEAMREQGLTEAQAAQKGLIVRDTVWVSAKDSLVKDGTEIAALYNNPFGDKKPIEVRTGTIDQIVGLDTIPQPVFEACIPFESYLADLPSARMKDKIQIAKEKAMGKGYPGLRIGSLTEMKMTGNWE
ncbi:MAG: hypothetical protein Q4A61_01060 [Porphyromonadaceae bacterium]|nr:hypothetical protein [Porphyromonadaceae bacterium]